jgi:hypothetical protein
MNIPAKTMVYLLLGILAEHTVTPPLDLSFITANEVKCKQLRDFFK